VRVFRNPEPQKFLPLILLMNEDEPFAFEKGRQSTLSSKCIQRDLDGEVLFKTPETKLLVIANEVMAPHGGGIALH